MRTGCSRYPLLLFMCYRGLQRVRMGHELHQWPSPALLPPSVPKVGSGEDNTLEGGSISIKTFFEIGVILSHLQNRSALWKAMKNDELARLCLQITSVTRECTEQRVFAS